MLDPCLLLESVTLWSLRHVATDSLWDHQRISLSPWPQLHPGLHGQQNPLALWNLVETSGKPTKSGSKRKRNMRNDRNTLYITKLPQKPEKGSSCWSTWTMLNSCNWVTQEHFFEAPNLGEIRNSTGFVSKISNRRKALGIRLGLAAVDVPGTSSNQNIWVVTSFSHVSYCFIVFMLQWEMWE